MRNEGAPNATGVAMRIDTFEGTNGMIIESDIQEMINTLVVSPGLLVAEVIREEWGTRLNVYRSLAVRDTDELYAPVRDFFAEHDHEVLFEPRTVRDEGWFLRHVTITSYVIG